MTLSAFCLEWFVILYVYFFLLLKIHWKRFRKVIKSTTKGVIFHWILWVVGVLHRSVLVLTFSHGRPSAIRNESRQRLRSHTADYPPLRGVKWLLNVLFTLPLSQREKTKEIKRFVNHINFSNSNDWYIRQNKSRDLFIKMFLLARISRERTFPPSNPKDTVY